MTEHMTEVELAEKLGVAKRVLAETRMTKLVDGVDWHYSGAPRRVWYSEGGVKAAMAAIGLETAVVVAPEPVVAGGKRWLTKEEIPAGPQNGLVLEHGRPGWWTEEECVVISNTFANRRSIWVRHNGGEKICRVRDAKNFVPRMLIPCRPYGNVVVAARHPRWPGKW